MTFQDWILKIEAKLIVSTKRSSSRFQEDLSSVERKRTI